MKGEEKPYCSIRQLYKTTEGNWLPSSKGVTFPAEHVEGLIPIILEAEELDPYPEEGKEFAFIPKNSAESVKFIAIKFKNSEYLDIRIYFKKDDEYHPTKKGLTVPPDCLYSLREGLEKFISK